MTDIDPGDLVLAIGFYLLLAILVGVFLFNEWAHSRDRVRDVWRTVSEDAKNLIADVLAWVRCWTWRRFVLQIGLYVIAIGQRLMEYGQQPETPHGAKLRIVISRRWERRDVVVTREADSAKATFGGRVVRFRL
jgi:hypothetical protein